jgi:lactoylglutathione lyase
MMETQGILGIDHIQMEVRDLDEAVSFWKETLSFQPVEAGIRLTMRWMILRESGGVSLSLHENTAIADEKRQGLKLTHFGIVPRDFNELHDHLIGLGVKVDSISTYDQSQSFYFYDPNGHKVEVSRKWGGGLGDQLDQS